MSFLFTKSHVSLKTAFPASVSREDILKVLHNHDGLLRRSPVITWVEPAKPSEPGVPAEGDSYRGVEWVHYVMRNSFIATYTDVEDGTNNESLCDFGIRLSIKYRVASASEVDGSNSENGPVLTEEVDIYAPYGVILYTKYVYEIIHRDIQNTLLQELGG